MLLGRRSTVNSGQCTRARSGSHPWLVQYCSPRLKAVEAWEVGPPWILTNSGGGAPGGATKSCSQATKCKDVKRITAPVGRSESSYVAAAGRWQQQTGVSWSWSVLRGLLAPTDARVVLPAPCCCHFRRFTVPQRSTDRPQASRPRSTDQPLAVQRSRACLVAGRVKVHVSCQAALSWELDCSRL